MDIKEVWGECLPHSRLIDFSSGLELGEWSCSLRKEEESSIVLTKSAGETAENIQPVA